MRLRLLQLFAIMGLSTLVSCTTPTGEIETASLKDTLISIAKDAKEAGAKEVKYTAHVVDATEGSAAIVIPTTPSVSLGAGRAREVGSKVEITIDIEEAANQAPSGKRYLLNPRTLESRSIPAM